jgi:hypothetical protein
MRTARTTIVALVMAGAACQPTPIAPPNGTGPKGAEMTRSDRLAPVQNDRIQFASMRPPGSRFAALERRIQVVGPPEAAQLTETGDPALLDELVPLLSVRDRAWAAEVMLAALTGLEADLVADYTGKPDAWIDGLGATAPARWKTWLDQHRAQLVWDAPSRSFVAR